MRWPVMLPALLFALLSPLGGDTSAAASSNTVDVTLQESRLDVAVGDRRTIRSTITNQGAVATNRLIAHLHVVNLDGVYVDLEEWTANPIVRLEPLAPGGSAEVSWDIQAPSSGGFNIYAVVVPSGGSSSDSLVVGASENPLVVSAPVNVTVTGRRTLTAGGALPVVLAVPVLLGAFAAAVRYHRLRRTS